MADTNDLTHLKRRIFLRSAARTSLCMVQEFFFVVVIFASALSEFGVPLARWTDHLGFLSMTFASVVVASLGSSLIMFPKPPPKARTGTDKAEAPRPQGEA